jgi:glucose/arabinose dehydrogenase
VTIGRHPPQTSLALSLVATLSLAAVLVAAPAAAGEPAAAAPAPQGVSGLSLIKSGFSQPVFVTHAGDGRLFVVERTGRIRILEQDGGWQLRGTFLDVRDLVSTGHSEQGLLGLAFHPDYADNGRFYVDYTDRSGDTIVAEYRRKRADKADAGSRRLVLKVGQPFDNHNGGWIGFWGRDLYIALGDGGSGGDPFENAQDKGVLLGKILRIDPLDPDGPGGRRYAIPGDNPLVGKAGRDEIWAWGLRNPWRDAFDRQTGDLWIGDVGQETFEEIDHAGNARGKDFGWDRLEGRHRYPNGGICQSGCDTLPVVEYRHRVSGADNCSVTGGYVARRAGASLEGRYVFGDYCSGRIWTIPVGFSGGPLPAPFDTELAISSFAEDAEGHLYVLSLSGSIHRIDGT